jgi:hypothetical protein
VATYFVLDLDLSSDEEAPQAATPAPLRPASLIGADDFDPFGGGEEHGYEVRNVYDDDKSTTWSTENYTSAVFPAGKTGVGIYVWSDNAVEARRLELLSPTPGFKAEVYGSNRTPEGIEDWGEPLATLKGDGERYRATLPGRNYERFLVWITDLPPEGTVEIADIRLLE